MRKRSLVLASAVLMSAAMCWVEVSAQPASAPAGKEPDLTLALALQIAESNNATLRATQAQLDAAHGARREARSPLYNNPQVLIDRTRRDVPQAGLPTDRRWEWGAGITQALEIAGQQGLRRDIAGASLTAVQEDIEATRRDVRAEVAQKFFRVLGLQQRITVEEQAVRLFEGTANAVQKRRAAGEDTKLDANLAAVESERAHNQLAMLQEQRDDAAAELGVAMQAASRILPKVTGDLERGLDAGLPNVDDLLATASSQPRLRSLTARVDSARSKLGLERAGRYPDVTVGVNVGREGSMDARERLTTLSVSLPLPVFRRNDAAIGQASTDLTQAQIEREAARRDLDSQVRVLWYRLQSLKQRVQRLKGSVLPTLADNEQLSLKSQRAGEIGLLELIVVNRQTLDARRDLIDALVDFQTTRIALEHAAGRVPAEDQGTQP